MAAGLELVESPLGAVHGVAVEIHHDGSGIFSSLPNPLAMVRYNSLVIRPDESELEVNAWDDSGTLPMAFSHPLHPLHSLQFHPESCGSEFGGKLLLAFISTTLDLQPRLAHG
jgi:anthranilate/para-aminobenzoate synthase component II